MFLLRLSLILVCFSTVKIQCRTLQENVSIQNSDRKNSNDTVWRPLGPIFVYPTKSIDETTTSAVKPKLDDRVGDSTEGYVVTNSQMTESKIIEIINAEQTEIYNGNSNIPLQTSKPVDNDEDEEDRTQIISENISSDKNEIKSEKIILVQKYTTEKVKREDGTIEIRTYIYGGFNNSEIVSNVTQIIDANEGDYFVPTVRPKTFSEKIVDDNVTLIDISKHVPMLFKHLQLLHENTTNINNTNDTKTDEIVRQQELNSNLTNFADKETSGILTLTPSRLEKLGEEFKKREDNDANVLAALNRNSRSPSIGRWDTIDSTVPVYKTIEFDYGPNKFNDLSKMFKTAKPINENSKIDLTSSYETDQPTYKDWEETSTYDNVDDAVAGSADDSYTYNPPESKDSYENEEISEEKKYQGMPYFYNNPQTMKVRLNPEKELSCNDHGKQEYVYSTPKKSIAKPSFESSHAGKNAKQMMPFYPYAPSSFVSMKPVIKHVPPKTSYGEPGPSYEVNIGNMQGPVISGLHEFPLEKDKRPKNTYDSYGTPHHTGTGSMKSSYHSQDLRPSESQMSAVEILMQNSLGKAYTLKDDGTLVPEDRK